jgi:hypothetical protein
MADQGEEIKTYGQLRKALKDTNKQKRIKNLNNG